MKEVRLSIPFVGGITVIYTAEEIAQKKANAKASLKAAALFTKKHVTQVITVGKAQAITVYNNREQYITKVREMMPCKRSVLSVDQK